MSRTYKDSSPRRTSVKHGGRRRNISVRAVRRDPPDYRKLSRAVVELALAENEAEAVATHPSAKSPETPAPDQEPHER